MLIHTPSGDISILVKASSAGRVVLGYTAPPEIRISRGGVRPKESAQTKGGA